MVTRETSISSGLTKLGLSAYGSRATVLAEFAELLVTEGRELGLIGKREAETVHERHVLESCALIPYLSDADSFIDVGSGAGLPGIPVVAATQLPAVLVESRARAAGFLRKAVSLLQLPATVLQGTAELAARSDLRESAGSVLARALAAPPVALELTLPFARPGGRVVLLVGPSAMDLTDRSAFAARELGGGEPDYAAVEVPGARAGSWVMIVDKVSPTPERYPRRPGVPRRRPLGGGVTGVE